MQKKKRRVPTNGTIEVFDIDNRWNEVVPHLQNPEVVRALTRA